VKSLNITVIVMLLVSTILKAQTATAPDSGDGTSGNPYHIATLENLYWIAVDNTRWNRYYIQTANINASETHSWSGGGWVTIGNSPSWFTGSYNGQKYIIDSLYISRSGNGIQGFFGYVANSATISNVYLSNVNFTGGEKVGALVGWNRGSTISDCFSSGSINGSQAGGLIGVNENSTVERCYSTCTVSGYSYIGGLIGWNVSGGTVSNSYGRGNVSGSEYIGGLIGSHDGSTISYCYSTGHVTVNYFGGGGLIAFNSSGNETVVNCFWDTQTSAFGTSAGGTGKTTAEMKTESTFINAGWNFTTMWEMLDSNYPRLQSNPEEALPIELISFHASIVNSGIALQWQTATEVNNYGFDVERCAVDVRHLQGDGHLAWMKTGFVEGSGTTNSPKQYSFSDKNLSIGKYLYRLKQIDRDGKFSYSKTVKISILGALKEFALSQNYPNPFNPSTMISYQLPTSNHISLKVYDALGREVATLVNEVKEAGRYSATFTASKLSSGIYFAKLQSGDKVHLKMMMLVK